MSELFDFAADGVLAIGILISTVPELNTVGIMIQQIAGAIDAEVDAANADSSTGAAVASGAGTIVGAQAGSMLGFELGGTAAAGIAVAYGAPLAAVAIGVGIP